MGQHKHNPTAIAARNGELPPKERPKLSKSGREALIRRRIQDATGLPQLIYTMGGEYFYI